MTARLSHEEFAGSGISLFHTPQFFSVYVLPSVLGLPERKEEKKKRRKEEKKKRLVWNKRGKKGGIPMVETLVEICEKLAKESESSGVMRTSTEVPLSGIFWIVRSKVKLPCVDAGGGRKGRGGKTGRG